MKKLVATAALAAMAGCATAEEAPVRGAGKCDAAKAQGLVGRTKSAKAGAEALRLSGADTLRWIAPGAMVTMDYRENRLNLRLDGRGRVTRISCG